MKIVFAGTPTFALPCLEALAHSSHTLLAVYTQPDRPSGRGRQLKASAVKDWAQAHSIPVFQPFHFKKDEVVAELASFKPDIMVVIAYGLILPPKVLSLPKWGCLNVHASLLPRWRGASPIQHALLHGESETGITIMQMDAGLDTGDQLACVRCPILPHDTAGSLQDRLAHVAIEPLLHTLQAFECGEVRPCAQENNLATYAGKIHKEDALIHWQKTAEEINNQIRAFNPWPVAYTTVRGERMRIYQAKVVHWPDLAKPGEVLSLDKQGLLVATGCQALMVECIQFPGGKPMSVANWLNAARSKLEVSEILT